jgi:hypothetical protein
VRLGRLLVALAVPSALGLSACSGESRDEGGVGASGVPRDKYLDELTPDEQRDLCTWAIAAQGGPGERACDEETTVTVPSVDECAADDLDFHCRVGLAEDCVVSLDGDPCALLVEPACQTYVECVLGDSEP